MWFAKSKCYQNWHRAYHENRKRGPAPILANFDCVLQKKYAPIQIGLKWTACSIFLPCSL